MTIAVLRPIFDCIKSPLFVLSSNLLSHMRRSLLPPLQISYFPVFHSSRMINSTGPLNFHHQKENHPASPPKVYRGEQIKWTSHSAWLELIFLFSRRTTLPKLTPSCHGIHSFFLILLFVIVDPQNCAVEKASLNPNLLTRHLYVLSSRGNC